MMLSLMMLSGTTEDTANATQGFIVVLVWIFAGIVIYFIPAIAAHKKPQSGSVLALNFFLGWTFVGWVVALAWALKNPERIVMSAPPAPPLQAAPPPAPSVFCSGCGKYSQAGSKFCSSCGGALATA
jgi:hypothetical protein